MPTERDHTPRCVKTLMSQPAHHADNSRTSFRNPWPSAAPSTWRDLSWRVPLSRYPAKQQRQRPPIEVIVPDWGTAELKERESRNYVVGTWLGHASALAEFKCSEQPPESESLYILFDPVFSMRAGPTQYTGPARFNKLPCSISDLPGCDVVCISHNHYDHLDTSTVLQILKFFPSVEWLVPLGIEAWLIATGVRRDKIQQMDWWDGWSGFRSKQGEGSASSIFRFSCVPAQHNSGRNGLDQASTLWCGWVVERFIDNGSGKTRMGAIYHAGDTGYRRSSSSKDVCPAFREIGTRFNGFDLAFIPIWRGGSLSWISYVGLRLHHHEIPAWNHCSPADALLIHKDVRSLNTVAIHFGTFVGSQNESDEALDELYAAIDGQGLGTLEAESAMSTSRVGAVNIGQSFVVEPTSLD